MANEFLIFNETSTNLMSQADYAVNSQRISGVTGIAISPLHNKIYRQASIISNMIGQFISNAGGNATDSDPAALLSAFSDAITAGIQEAGEGVAGTIEIATQTEMIEGTNNTKAVTPYLIKTNIANIIPHASQTTLGIVQQATNAEAEAGTNNTKYVTPAQVALAAPEPSTATESIFGTIRIATQAEVTAGTADNRTITPLKYKTDLNNILVNYAPLTSPQFTGTPANITAATNYVTPRIANTLIGTVAPTAAQGINGDIYIQY